MFARCVSTVFSLIVSTSAICRFVWLSAMSLTICCSRGVSGSSGGVSPARARCDVVADERALGPGVQERLAAHRGAARLDEVAVGDGLEDVARASRP